MPLFPFFFFNDTATTEIYTLSLHDALPISLFFADPLDCRDMQRSRIVHQHIQPPESLHRSLHRPLDRKSTRLNSSHGYISYAVFCLKKKKTWYYAACGPYLLSCLLRISTCR